ncbi:hypothetical protein BDV23DRAFT_158632 [Aspergillus alliaceus]|uniref:Uncharacterized protein n=1 Tax=Petromyces alliaceus TaxID=209559 RepID=A0A5N7C379_PETAA|nr:hypothetical protein BDV23DRAFT_158632 [Aspergillus alliaceus]
MVKLFEANDIYDGAFLVISQPLIDQAMHRSAWMNCKWTYDECVQSNHLNPQIIKYILSASLTRGYTERTQYVELSPH